MLVNHIQVAYVLQITPLEAKFMLAPHIERIREMVIPGKKSLDECARLVRKTDVVESLLLNIRFRHPSPELDGKDRIAYTIEKLKEAPLSLKKKIADDPGCLKSGKISGKFRALNSILEEESIKEIKEILRLRGGHIGRKDTAMSQKKRRKVSRSWPLTLTERLREAAFPISWGNNRMPVKCCANCTEEATISLSGPAAAERTCLMQSIGCWSTTFPLTG